MEASNQYDDSAKGGYSYEEKLKLVAEGNMAPEEIGLASADQAQEQVPQEPELGKYITFETSEVPLELRALWARQELKIQPANPKGWIADYIEEHSNEHLIQARVRSGNQQGVLQRLVTEPVLGMILLMREAADLMEKKYADLQGKEKLETK